MLQDPTASLARRLLQPYMDELGSRLLRPECKELSNLGNPLGRHVGLPLLPTPRQTFLSVQCLVNNLLVCALGGARLLHGVTVSWHGHLLWSSFAPADSTALHHFSIRALLPAADISTLKSTSKINPLTESLLCSKQWTAVPPPKFGATNAQPSAVFPLPTSTPPEVHLSRTSSAVDHLSQQGSRSTSSSSPRVAYSGRPAASSCAPAQQHFPAEGYLVPRLRQTVIGNTASWQVGGSAGDLAGTSHSQQPEVVKSTRVWLQGAQEHFQMLPYYNGSLCVLLVLHDEGAQEHFQMLPYYNGSLLVLPAQHDEGAQEHFQMLPYYNGSLLVLPALHDRVSANANTKITPGILHTTGPYQPGSFHCRGAQEHFQMLPYYNGSLLVLLALHDGVSANQEVLTILNEVLSRQCPVAIASLNETVPLRNLWHVPGYRYSYSDTSINATR
eukprot:gene7685-846_t